MTAREIKYIGQALKNYRSVSYGQFDQETRRKVEETQDGAEAIEYLMELAGERRREFQYLCVLLNTSGFKIPDDVQVFLQKLNVSDI